MRDGLDQCLPELDGPQAQRGECLVDGLLLVLLRRVCGNGGFRGQRSRQVTGQARSEIGLCDIIICRLLHG